VRADVPDGDVAAETRERDDEPADDRADFERDGDRVDATTEDFPR
jgi:hypothetical protein